MFHFKKYLMLLIGLEIHINLNTKKIFSNNKNTTIYEFSYPGVLPVFNFLIKQIIIFFCLNFNNCFYNYSLFERKLYFYYDLPKNYQITQNNFQSIFNLLFINYCKKKILIKKIHLEEDACSYNEIFKFVNYDRSSNSLIEIVTEPNFKSINCSILFIKKISKILKNNKISNCNLNEGDIRIDVNLSIINKINLKKSKKIEIKNLNSYEKISNSINYEIVRLFLILEKNKKNIFTTRSFVNDKTITIRKKYSKKYDFHIDYDIGIISYYNYDYFIKINKKFQLKKIFLFLPKKKYYLFKKHYFKKKFNLKKFVFISYSKKNKIMINFNFNYFIKFYLNNNKKKILVFFKKKKINKIFYYFNLINNVKISF